MDARKKQQAVVPQAQQIKEEEKVKVEDQRESRTVASHGAAAAQRGAGKGKGPAPAAVASPGAAAPQRGGKGKGAAPAVLALRGAAPPQRGGGGGKGAAAPDVAKATYKGKEAVKPVVKKHYSAAIIRAQNANDMEMERTVAPRAHQQIKKRLEVEGQGGSRSVAPPRGVLKRGDKGKGTAPPPFVDAAYKGKEAVKPVVKRPYSAARIRAQNTVAMGMERTVVPRAHQQIKNKVGVEDQGGSRSAYKRKEAVVESAVKAKGSMAAHKEEAEVEVMVVVRPPPPMVLVSSDEEKESEDNDSGSDSEYKPEKVVATMAGRKRKETVNSVVKKPAVAISAPKTKAMEEKKKKESVRKVVEEPVVVEGTKTYEGDNTESPIVKVRKFEGCSMLAEVDSTEDDGGIASRIRRRKVGNRRQNSQLDDKGAKGTFSDPVDL